MTQIRTPQSRKNTDIRPLELIPNFNRYAEGSILIKCGHTHVLCTASVQESVPRWIEEQNLEQGWITAEYSMLPRSTHTRSKRDREHVSGRTQEIQRLIARALRACVDLKKLGKRSIIIDCDVLQADGGTRTTSINGGCIALGLAIGKLLQTGTLKENPWIESVSAISIGIRNGEILTDLDYNEDSRCDVDMNFVITQNEEFIEVQGTGEKKSFTPQELQQMTDAALAASQRLKKIQAEHFNF